MNWRFPFGSIRSVRCTFVFGIAALAVRLTFRSAPLAHLNSGLTKDITEVSPEDGPTSLEKPRTFLDAAAGLKRVSQAAE